MTSAQDRNHVSLSICIFSLFYDTLHPQLPRFRRVMGVLRNAVHVLMVFTISPVCHQTLVPVCFFLQARKPDSATKWPQLSAW